MVGWLVGGGAGTTAGSAMSTDDSEARQLLAASHQVRLHLIRTMVKLGTHRISAAFRNDKPGSWCPGPPPYPGSSIYFILFGFFIKYIKYAISST